MGYKYAILGSGRQGTATAYDLAVNGDSDLIILADADLKQAEKAAERVNKLSKRSVCKAALIDAKDEKSVQHLLSFNGINVTISGVPYFFNLALSKAAIHAGSSFCDYGGNTEVVLKQLELNQEAQSARLSVIPDCGMVPGMGNSLTAYAYSLLDQCDELICFDGGLPQKKVPPWNYVLTFSIEGLTNEYFGKAHWLKNGEHFETDTFEKLEFVVFPDPIGQLEAFTTAGGTSTLPWTYHGKVKTLYNKTLRWPGHFAQWKNFQQAGLFDLDPVEVDGQKVIPRHLFHAIMDPKIRAKETDRDMIIIRIIARGTKDGKQTEIILDMIDNFDEKTGFTAMERATGFHAGIMSYLMARGLTRRGAVAVESAVDPQTFMQEFHKRGFTVKEEIKELASAK